MRPDYHSGMHYELDWLRRWAVYSPSAVAIKDADTGRQLTYKGFFEAANRLAGFLRSRHGIDRGDRVAVLAQNELEYVLLLFAVQRLQAILVPVNFRLTPSREIAHILSDSGAKLLIHQKEYGAIVASMDCPTLAFEGPESLSSAAFDASLPCNLISMEGVAPRNLRS